MNQNRRLIKVAAIGQDRLGIINSVAGEVKRHDGNIILLRSMLAAGEFSLILVASFHGEDLAGVQNCLKAFGNGSFGENFFVFAREITLESYAPQEETGSKYVMTIKGHDQEGIIDAMTLFLLLHSINSGCWHAEVTHYPFSGTEIFSAMFEINIREGIDMETFKAELEQFERDYDLQIDLEALSQVEPCEFAEAVLV